MNSVLSLLGLGSAASSPAAAARPAASSDEGGNNVLKVYTHAVWDKLEERVAAGKGPEASSLHILVSLLDAKTQDLRLKKAPPARLTVPGSFQVDELRVALSKYTEGAMRVGRVYLVGQKGTKELANGQSLHAQGIRSGMKLSVEALATDHIRRAVCSHIPLDRFEEIAHPSTAQENGGQGRALVQSTLPSGPITSVMPMDPVNQSVLGGKVPEQKGGRKRGRPSASRGKYDDLFEEEDAAAVQDEIEEDDDDGLAARPLARQSGKKRKASKPSAPPGLSGGNVQASAPEEDPEPEPEPALEPAAPQKTAWDEEANLYLLEGVRKYCVRTSSEFTGMAWAKIALEGRGIMPISSRVAANASCKDRWRTFVKNVEKDFVGSRDKSFTERVKELAKEVHEEEKQGLDHEMEDPEEEGEEEEEEEEEEE